jgi:hypothetical protein
MIDRDQQFFELYKATITGLSARVIDGYPDGAPDIAEEAYKIAEATHAKLDQATAASEGAKVGDRSERGYHTPHDPLEK